MIPFLDKGKTFYLGLGTVAFDMFIVIMMTGIYRARLAASMSPKAWRVIHGSAYAAWIFGLVHGLLAGRPAEAFFGFSGFVYWAYGACVAGVAVALVVRMAAKNRAGNELASNPVADAGGTGGWTAAAAALSGAGALPGAAALTATAMPAPALPAGSPGALDGARARASRQSGRAPLALPAGPSAASQHGRPMRSAPYDERAAYLAENRRIGASGPIGPGATGSFPRVSQFDGAGQDFRDGASQYGPTGPMPRVAPYEQAGPLPRAAHYEQAGPPPQVSHYEQTGPMPRDGQYEQGGYRYERTGQIDRPGEYERPQPGHMQAPRMQPGQMQPGQLPPGRLLPGQMPGSRVPGARPPGGPGGPGGYQSPLPAPRASGPGPSGPAQYGQPMSRQYGQTGPYERPHDDWSGPMERIGPPAEAPRYEAGRYNDWSGPLERIDPAAPPAQYGVGGQYGGTGQYEPPHAEPRYAEPRYERTGEIDRSGQYAQPQYGPPSGQPPYPARAPQYGRPGYGPPAYGQEGQPGRPLPRQPEPFGQYGRPHPAQYQSPAGYDRSGEPGRYGPPTRYEEPMQYDQFQRGTGSPAGQSGQPGRPGYDQQERAAHYASFAEQDATYTRPRPAGTRDHFSPQDETDPLNIVPLNTGNYL